MTPRGRLLLLGGGPAHLCVLEALARGRLAAESVMVVAPEPLQLYAGMLPGYLEGRYPIEQASVDLQALARAVGATFQRGTVERIDAGARRVVLDDGTSLPYDVASISIGGPPAGHHLPGVARFARFTRPWRRAVELREALDRAAAGAGPEPLQVIVVGAGAAGVEVALSARARLDRLGASRAVISLLESTHVVLRNRSLAAQEEAERALARAEVTLRLSTGATEVGPDHVRLGSGRVLPAEVVIWTTGTDASPVFRASGLPVDARGYLLVDEDLAVRDTQGLFGAGEAVARSSFPRLPAAGIRAMRQGPVLAWNLARALQGAGASRRYTPAPRFLGLLSTGDGRAIVSYGGFAATTGWALSLKDRMDRRFLRRFHRLSGGAPMAVVP